MADPPITDTSVTISLAELTRIEAERVSHEEAERARIRAERARQERELEAKRRAEQAAELARVEDERARRARVEAIEKARLEAREQAAAEVARIEAEAKARLDVENATRAHELAVLRVKKETGRRRREYVLGAALALVTCLGAVAGFVLQARFGELAAATDELRGRERALERERDDAGRTELTALDRRFAALSARTMARGADEARKVAEQVRRSIDESSPGHERLHAFADALDALASRIDALEKLDALGRRHSDLLEFARAMRRTQAIETAERAAAAAKAPHAGAETLIAYERALDQLSAKLSERTATARHGAVPATDHAPDCDPHDPGCGIDGKRVF